MNLDHRRTQFRRHLDLARIGGDEQRNPDAGIAEPRDERRQRIALTDDIETAFGGEFLAPLRHETHRMRLGCQRDPQHLRGRGHLEIERL